MFTFCEGKIGGSKGGDHEFGGCEIFEKKSNCAPTYSTIPMRCGVHVVRKMYHCGGAARAYSRAIAVFRFFNPIFRLWATFTRPFCSQHILVLKYAAPRPQAAARTLQLVLYTNARISDTPGSHKFETDNEEGSTWKVRSGIPV